MAWTSASRAQPPRSAIADDEAALRSALSAPAGADGGLEDVDAVSGASLGVEGVIERGRAALSHAQARL